VVKLPPDLERKVLELAGVKPAAKPRRGEVELVAASHPAPGVWVIPFECVNESNQRRWQGRSRRAGAAWRAVRAVIRIADLWQFETLHDCGRPIRARFVRLGGKRLDPLANLPASLKGIEDAVAYLVGIDDGDPRWVPSCDQEPGGPAGVRVELEAE
jgi:FAD/FMN-containing dehydrogenase